MASNVKLSATARSDRMTALNNLIGTSAKIRIYDGTQPAGPGTAITTQTLLAELTGNASAFGTVSNGVLTANAITADSTADNSGTASWFRVLTSGGTAVLDGTAGTSNADLILTTTSIVAAANVSITSLTITDGNA